MHSKPRIWKNPTFSYWMVTLPSTKTTTGYVTCAFPDWSLAMQYAHRFTREI